MHSINAGAAVWTFAYGYNANGHLSSQTYPGNLVIGYAPDGLGRPTQAGTFASNVTYYPTARCRASATATASSIR